ncbi:MAG: hypothetical protein AAF805_00495 [Planctomycetota bacterium]
MRIRNLLALALAAAAGVSQIGCRACSNCHDYGSPVAGAACGGCHGARAGTCLAGEPTGEAAVGDRVAAEPSGSPVVR